VKKPIRFSSLFDSLLVLFLLTGLSGLVYEVAWFRLLSLTFGVSVYAASAVLTAFMGGLALGSWLFGSILDFRLPILDFRLPIFDLPWRRRLREGASDGEDAQSNPQSKIQNLPSPLAVFGFLQLGIGLYALATPLLFTQLTSAYVALYRAFEPDQGAFVALRIMLATLVLLPPTVLMGGTLPTLARLLRGEERDDSRALGSLYAVNILGGVTGALLAGVLLLPLIGTSATLFVAGAIDLLIGAIALWLSRRPILDDRGRETQSAKRKAQKSAATTQNSNLKAQNSRQGAAETQTSKLKTQNSSRAAATQNSNLKTQNSKSGRAVLVPHASGAAALAIETTEQAEARPLLHVPAARIALLGFALSGFASLGYQVVWTRLLAIFSLNAVYSFTIMLATFLAGLAIGSALMARRVARVEQPLALFGWLQLATGVCGVLVLFAFARMRTLLDTFTVRDTFVTSLWAEFFAAAITMLLPTILLGAMFPLAARLYASADERPKTKDQADERPKTKDQSAPVAQADARPSLVPRPSSSVARRVGRLYALNTLGAMLGAAAAGFVLIPLIGLQRAALLLALINLAVGVLALLATPTGRRARVAMGATVAAAALAALLLPPGVYLGFREGVIPELAFYREGVDATVAVFEVKQPPLKISFVNGRSEVPTDQHSMRAFYLLGHLPALLKPEAEDALMVSFGNGIATGTLSTHNVPRIQAVELVAEQIEAARLYSAENRDVLDYPGLRLTVEDGRNYLLRSDATYDIITADATHPINTSSWALFTREFYTLVDAHMAEDGVFIQWLPFHDLSQRDYRAIIATFRSVFPNTTLWYTGGTHSFLLATPKPLTRADVLALDAALRNGPASADLGDGTRLASDLLMETAEVDAYVAGARIVTDDTAFFIPSRDMDAIMRSFQPYRR
jgi:spermidine synthase